MYKSENENKVRTRQYLAARIGSAMVLGGLLLPATTALTSHTALASSFQSQGAKAAYLSASKGEDDKRAVLVCFRDHDEDFDHDDSDHDGDFDDKSHDGRKCGIVYVTLNVRVDQKVEQKNDQKLDQKNDQKVDTDQKNDQKVDTDQKADNDQKVEIHKDEHKKDDHKKDDHKKDDHK